MELERGLGEQPLASQMTKRDLKPADLVAASKEQITHKMVTRGTKGWRLTPNVMGKVIRAFAAAAGETATAGELFNYPLRARLDQERPHGQDVGTATTE